MVFLKVSTPCEGDVESGKEMGTKPIKIKNIILLKNNILCYTKRSTNSELTLKTDQEREGFITLSSLRALHFVQLANMSLY